MLTVGVKEVVYDTACKFERCMPQVVVCTGTLVDVTKSVNVAYITLIIVEVPNNGGSENNTPCTILAEIEVNINACLGCEVVYIVILTLCPNVAPSKSIKGFNLNKARLVNITEKEIGYIKS